MPLFCLSNIMNDDEHKNNDDGCVGMIALARRESRYRLCVVSAIVSGLMMIIWLTVFLNGLR